MRVTNAKTLPKRYYGLHMVEGVAEYNPPGGEMYRIFISAETMLKADATFEGIPVYVNHVEEVNMENLQQEADGYIVRSFFNKADGRHWVEFMVVSDRGHEAIAKGWRLSNGYIVKSLGAGGKWNGIDFDKEVTEYEYEHMAIVERPRYDQSVVLTPEQFKAYNEEKEIELARVANSLETKEEKVSMFNIFKKSKVENSADIEGMSVVLPKSKREAELKTILNEADEAALKNGVANGDDKVKVGEDEMTVNELVEKYNSLMEEKKNSKAEDEKKENAEEDKKEENSEEDKDKKNSEEKKDEKQTNALDELKNAPIKAIQNSVIETARDGVERGKLRYGSNK